MLDFMNANTSKYYKELNSLDINLDILNSIKEETNYEYYSSYVVPIIINDKMYISWYVWNSSGENDIIWIDFDFTKYEVKDYVLVSENKK